MSDAVVIEPVSRGPIRVGDVITFRGYGAEHLTTHRVTKVVEVQGRTHFQARGDANDTPDPNPAPADVVVGRVIFTLPKIGWLLLRGLGAEWEAGPPGLPGGHPPRPAGSPLLAYRRTRGRDAAPAADALLA